MRTPFIILSAFALGALALVGCSQEHATTEAAVEEAPKPAQEAAVPETPDVEEITGQPTCPVMGNPVSRALHTDYQGKRVYFCCPPCVKKFENDPDKFMQVIEEKGMKLEDAPGGE